MSSYFLPGSLSLNQSSRAAGNGSNNSILANSGENGQASSSSSRYSALDPSIEHGRGAPASRPPVLQRSPEADFRFPREGERAFAEPELGRHSFLAKYEQPMEVRRRIPGCGINQYDPRDEPVAAERSPVHAKSPVFDHSGVEKLFDQFDKDPSVGAMFGKEKFVQEHFQTRTYGRRRPPAPAVPRFFRVPSAAAILSSSEQALASTQSQRDLLRQRQVHDPRYPFFFGQLSPLALSSSSSSSPDSSLSSLQSYSQFRPVDESTFMNTPPQQGLGSAGQRNWGRTGRNRAYTVPSPQGTANFSAASSGPSSSPSSVGEGLPESPIPSPRGNLPPCLRSYSK